MGKKIVIELEVNNDAAIQDLNEVKKGFKKVIDEQGKQTKATEDSTKATSKLGDKLDSVTGGAVSKFRNLTSGVKKSTLSFKALRIAIAATGIGLLVTTIAALVANLQNSEGGFNRVQKVMKQIGVVAGNVTDIFYSLGTALFSLVTRDFEQMNKSFEEATNRIKNFGDETEREIKLQGELADKQADLVKLERELVVERADSNRKRADLLEKAADKENFTASQRIKFLKEAAKVDEDITNKEIDAAKIRLQIKEQENTLSESSAEDLNEEARLKAALIDLETQRLTKQKTVTAQITSAIREEQTEVKALSKAREDEIKTFQEQQDALDKILGDSVTKRTNLQLKGDKDVANNLRKLQSLKNDNAEQDVALIELTEQQKLGIIGGAMGSIAQLLGENSAAGKAAAISQAVINSYLGFTEVLKTPSTLPQPFATIEKIASAGSVLASGLATVKQITSVKTPTFGKAISTGGGGGGRSVSAPQAPAFNVVGASPENQLAQALGQQDKQPIKAFVVSNEVTNAQALDRNIVNSASLG